MVLMRRRAEQLPRHVFPREDRDDAGDRFGARRIDLHDARVRVRRTQHLKMQQPSEHRLVGIEIHRVARMSGDDCFAERVAQAGAAGMACPIFLRLGLARERIRDGAVAGAAAEIALEGMRQVGELRLGERGRGHDHAGRAITALIGLCVQEPALHLMQVAALAQALDGCHALARCAEGRHQAGVHWLVVEPDRAGTAIPCVAAFLDAKRTVLSQIGAQALAGTRRRRNRASVNDAGSIVHGAAPSSSARISAAK